MLQTLTQPAEGEYVAIPSTATPMLVTPEMATRWLQQCIYDQQRTLRSSHVDRLVLAMQRGDFAQGTTAIIIAHCGDHDYLLDGQHRLWAIVLSELPQYLVVVQKFFANDNEMAKEYRRIDHNRLRTDSDYHHALGLATEFGMSESQLRSLNAAVHFMLSGCFASRRPRGLHEDTIVECMRVYATPMREYLELIEPCAAAIMRQRALRVPTLALALLTLRFGEPRVTVRRSEPSVAGFWYGVVFDDGIPADDPRKIATRHLLSTAIAGGSSGQHKDYITASESVRYLGRCYTSYMAGQVVQRIRFDREGPLNVLGVPTDPHEWW